MVNKVRYDKAANKKWRRLKELKRRQMGLPKTSEGDSCDDVLYDKSADTVLGRKLTTLSRGGEVKRSSEIEIGKNDPANTIMRRRERLLKKLNKKLNKGLRAPGERLQRESVLYEMAALLGPDADLEDEKKILKQIKLLKRISSKIEFEKELERLLTKINAIRRSNDMDTIDRTELLSKTMKQDVSREVKEKKKAAKEKEKEEYKKIKEKEKTILKKFVPIKLLETSKKYVYLKKRFLDNIYFKAEYFGKDFSIKIKVYPGTKFKIISEYGKVLNINKRNLIGEIRFPGGDKYKYGSKIIFKKNPDFGEITAKVVRL